MSNISVTLPNGAVQSVAPGTTPLEIAAKIGKRLESDAIAAKVDGKVVDVTTPLSKDCQLAIITKGTPEGLEVIRHSTAHLLAQAVKELYPTSQITIGPVIEDGFYYDIAFPETITPEHLPAIEKRMEQIAARNLPVKRIEMKSEEAVKLFEGLNEGYKAELIKGFPKSEVVSAYEQGEFIDLCRGPHVPNTSKLGKFKLLSVAGAYWRGNENNAMLTRIYGTAFFTQAELQDYLSRIEEAKKRDHRKLGPEMQLFTFLPIAPAMPFYLAKGTTLYHLLQDFMREQMKPLGYQEVKCPQLFNVDLWKTSGHWDNYQDNMFTLNDPNSAGMGLKPMNCPGHCALFASTHHSYRDLPLRLSEFTNLHRNERAGVTHGLFRTRAFSQDDAHIFCTEDQIGAESKTLIDLIFRVYKMFGFQNTVVKLATRPEKFMGEVATWDKATEVLAKTLTESGIQFDYANGEGAFYGPKIEFHIKDSLSRFWQCGTIQLDFNLPERFNLQYIDKDNTPKRPVMIHRAVLGSVGRFMGVITEHFAGHFPLWIAPVQMTVINVTEGQEAYAKKIFENLKAQGLRVELDSRNEKLSYKIREAQIQRIPLMIILGDKEMAAQTVSVRKTTGENLQNLSLEQFQEFLKPQLKPGA